MHRTDPQFWSDQVTRFQEINELVERHLAKATHRQVKNYNLGRHAVVFKVGDLVLRREIQLSRNSQNFVSKLAPPYSGTYHVSKVISPSVHEIKWQNSRKIAKTHVRFLKPYVTNNCSIVQMSGKIANRSLHGPYRGGGYRPHYGATDSAPNSSFKRCLLILRF